MRKILPGLYSFSGLVLGRVYLVKDPDGLTIIDAGLPHAPYIIARELRAAGYSLSDVKRILITHAHPDHIGGLRKLAAMTGAQVVCSAVEQPVIEGRVPIPRRPLSTLSRFERATRPPLVTLRGTPVARPVEDGDTLADVMGGLRVVATPGHTPGHITFWQPRLGVAFCGDVIAASLGLRLPSRSWTVDMGENRRSVARLAGLSPKVVCFGHGQPLRHNTAKVIACFARRVSI